jgi:hypothetical protein
MSQSIEFDTPVITHVYCEGEKGEDNVVRKLKVWRIVVCPNPDDCHCEEK